MRKKFVFVASAILMYVIFLEGCVYHKGDDAYPPTGGGGDCNDSNVRYSVEIKSILDANCISCHNGTASISGIDLYDHQTISTLALDKKFTYGTLLSAVLHKGGAPLMPQGLPQLGDCEINKIATWVYQGAQDN